MLLSPRYGADPPISIDGPSDDVLEPLVRQARRLEAGLAGLTEAQWGRPSRCAEWCVHDVVAHLVDTNTFWGVSIQAGLAGAPTRFLAGFDPAATPSQMVAAKPAITPGETLEQLIEANRSVIDALEALDDEGWSTLAESPPGHVPLRLLASHALWDAWVHERDILLPLGIAPAEEPDEVMACLRYVAALSPAFAIAVDPSRRGSLVIDASDPDVHLVVDIGSTVAVHTGSAPAGAAELTGRAVDLVEMLSLRMPFGFAVPAEHRWVFDGLAQVFDAELV